jgi:2-methylcitrate dehydratase PrpD
MDKVRVVANDEFDALFPKFQPGRVTITTKHGKERQCIMNLEKVGKLDELLALTVARA